MNHTIDVLSAENLPETSSVPAAFILCLIPAAVIFFSRRFRGSTFLRRAAAVLCSVPALFLCAGYLPAAQAQDTCTTWNDVSSWSGLYTAMQSGGCFKLTASVTYDGTDDTPKLLQVPSGKPVTLDLNGNTINRGLTGQDAREDGYVISVSGTLNLTDSGTDGTITGGNNISDGGGVYVATGGTFTMTGGTISGNSAQYGGGVYVTGTGATFTMSGGTIGGTDTNSGFWRRRGVCVRKRHLHHVQRYDLPKYRCRTRRRGICIRKRHLHHVQRYDLRQYFFQWQRRRGI